MTVTNNLFIGAIDKPQGIMIEPATFIYMYTIYNPDTDGITVTGNIG